MAKNGRRVGWGTNSGPTGEECCRRPSSPILSVAIEICLGAEGGGLLINFVANGIGTGNWAGAAETLGEGALIDAVDFSQPACF